MGNARLYEIMKEKDALYAKEDFSEEDQTPSKLRKRGTHMEEKLFQFIQDTVASVTGKRDMVYETDFVKDLGLNSFDIMNVVCAFEEHFDVDIPNRDVWQMHQVIDVVRYLMARYAYISCLSQKLTQRMTKSEGSSHAICVSVPRPMALWYPAVN